MGRSMPVEPYQYALAAVELTLLFAGAGLLLWVLSSRQRRQHWLGTHALPHWPVTLPEFLFAALLVFAGGFLLQAAAHQALGGLISASGDRAGLEIFVYGASFHAGILAGIALFPRLRRRLYADYGAPPPPPPPPGRRVTGGDALRLGAGTVLVVLPVLTLISLGWTALLRALGLPDAPQDLIAVFAATKSSWVVIGMLVVACGLAPLSEELMFRAGLYRYIRQRVGRAPALLVSGLCFGVLHGNWAGFLPLAVLGMMLAVAYEATGSLRVAIVAHSLFNLNTVLVVLSGLPELGS
jgi:membrane protease YdiL (CAAX protease family)